MARMRGEVGGEADVRGAAGFVGRAEELAALDAGLASAWSGQGTLFLLTGESGIGKTHLAREVAARAVVRGFDVLWGRCGECAGAPAYDPWMQIIRGLAQVRNAHALVAPLDATSRRIARLVPELVGRDAGVTTLATDAGIVPSFAESEDARLRLFEAVTERFRRATVERPLLLVVDDLHRANLPTLSLLRRVTRSLPDLAMMIVATLGDAGSRLATHGEGVFAALNGGGTRFTLGPWSRDEVRNRVESILAEPPTRLVDVIFESSRGNPLYVEGFARLVRDHPEVELHDGFPFGVRIPGGIRGVARERLRPIPANVTRTLEAAAVIGSRFEPRVLEAVLEQSRAEVDDRLVAAVDAEILVGPEASSDRYGFMHSVMREVVYAEILPEDRRRLHRRVAVALEEVFVDRLDEYASRIAHHLFEAGFEGDRRHALESACRAAVFAERQCAYEEAVSLISRALSICAATGADDEVRCELLVELGAAHRRAGNDVRARQVCSQAALLARSLGAGELLARAALCLGAVPSAPGVADPELVGLLEESRRYLGPEPSALAAIVSSWLAIRLDAPSDAARRRSVCREAIEVARMSGGDEEMGHALDARHLVFWGQTDLSGQRSLADGVIEAAERRGHREMCLHGHQLRLADSLEMGDIAAVDLEIETYARLAAEQPLARYDFRLRAFQAMRAGIAGDFDRAARCAAAAHELGTGMDPVLASIVYGQQMLMIARLRGPTGDVERVLLRLLETHPSISALRLGLAGLYADLGRRDEALALFEREAAGGFRTLALDGNWLMSCATAAEVCASLGDRACGEILLEKLRSFAGRNAVAALAVACNGSVSRPLGQLAALLGQPEESQEYLEDAIACDSRMGALPFVLRSQLALASLYASAEGVDAGRAEDTRVRARALSAEVERAAGEFGMQGVCERAATLRAQLDARLG